MLNLRVQNFTASKMLGMILEKQYVKLLMASQGRKLRLQLGILVKKFYL